MFTGSSRTGRIKIKTTRVKKLVFSHDLRQFTEKTFLTLLVYHKGKSKITPHNVTDNKNLTGWECKDPI